MSTEIHATNCYLVNYCHPGRTPNSYDRYILSRRTEVKPEIADVLDAIDWSRVSYGKTTQDNRIYSAYVLKHYLLLLGLSTENTGNGSKNKDIFVARLLAARNNTDI